MVYLMAIAFRNLVVDLHDLNPRRALSIRNKEKGRFLAALACVYARSR
jgi:hypothetical protein